MYHNTVMTTQHLGRYSVSGVSHNTTVIALSHLHAMHILHLISHYNTNTSPMKCTLITNLSQLN